MLVPVAIVTDSTSDIDAASAADLRIDVVPLLVLFGERRYTDGAELTRADFYQKLRDERALPATSAPTSKMFEEVFAGHVAAGRDIVCVVLSPTFSGTINAARAAAGQFSGAGIHVIDSKTVAAGLGLQVRRAAELAQAGASAPEVLRSLCRDRNAQHAFATLPDLSHAVRTGRVGRAAAMLGTLVKILPVFRIVDGKIEHEAQVRTFGRARQVMIEATLQALPDPSVARIEVMHAAAPEEAMRLHEMLREKLPVAPRYLGISEAGPVLAVHAGAGAVGIFSVGA
ncbi:MAG: DegV family protein [Candidatus Eremiobacteraeota bacterium]|nr:DegV family protein [Candidatus Eremiobacteraeota bacterium]